MTENEKKIDSIDQEIKRLQGERDQLRDKGQQPSEEEKNHFRQLIKN
ncbi:hypothetical protein SAMN04488033_11699 [Salegentibacter agarivorans]|uniref:Uncharacterized protein n=1 Tax=Salegentibacter agarivorans TaxID=345907 RepID=A0A1I2N425_9FLAO|nr:hypothetical protein [Salegentibacter agarivorans]SFF96141.1 hypothetical protein SAMN04488033_11699 [Salegentibacter agarivorans]